MATNQDNEVLFSDVQIARMTGIRRGEIIQAANGKGYTGRFVNGMWCLTAQEADEVIAAVHARMAVDNNYYEIPSYLRSVNTKWSETLIRMYSEVFASPLSLSPDQGQLLWSLVRNLSPVNIVEIGCFVGVSTIWMGAALDELGGTGMVHSIDRFEPIRPNHPFHHAHVQDPLNFVQSCVDSAGLAHRVVLHQGDSAEVGREIRGIIGGTIDLLFMDGDHSVSGCLTDFLVYGPHVSVGGYILMHDINSRLADADGPRHVIDHIVKHVPWLEVVEMSTNPRDFGVAIIRKLA